MTCSAEEIRTVMWSAASLAILVVWNIAAVWLIVSARKGGQHGTE